MSSLRPSVDDAPSSTDAESDEAWAFAAVPIPVLYAEAQAAMAAGAWAEACDLLEEIMRLEPGFGQDGQSARELFRRARREYSRATRRSPVIGPWPLLVSAVVLVLAPLAAGLATGTLTLSLPHMAAVVEPLPPQPTVVPVQPTLAEAQPTLVPAQPTAAAVVAVLPLAPAATPKSVATRAPALSSTPIVRLGAGLRMAREPDRAQAIDAAESPTMEAAPTVQPAPAAAPALAAVRAPAPPPSAPAAAAPAIVAPATIVPATDVPAIAAPPTPEAAADYAAPTELPAPQVVARAQDDCATYDNPDTPCALADGSVVAGYIGSQGSRNYFWFGVPVPDMHVSIRLTDLPADYDLYLFSDQVADPGQPILSSVTPDTAPETIDAVLHDTGTYVVEVVDDPSVPNVPDVPYTLSFGLQAAPAPALELTPLPTPTPVPAATPEPSVVSVPAVRGQSATAASRLLRDAGLVVQVSSADAYSPAGPDTVATQDPPAAARLAPGSTVRLGIATGRVGIPTVRGKPEQEALATLRAAGFDIQTRRRADDTVPSGLALGTNPGEGSVLSSGSSLELLISQGH